MASISPSFLRGSTWCPIKQKSNFGNLFWSKVNAIDHSDTYHMESLNLTIPNKISGVDEKYLNPREAWEDKDMYDTEAKKLAQRFKDNIKKFEVSEEILASGPK